MMNKISTGTPSFAVSHQVERLHTDSGMTESFGSDGFSQGVGQTLSSYVWEAAADRRAAPIYLYRDVVKRAIDILFIIMTLPFSLPIILFCAFALWLEGGNPFYTQDRLGKDGKRFSIFKLRTMVRDADRKLGTYLAQNPDARTEWDRFQKLKDDPRITPIGKVLRASSLDELPQLFNVFTGDMSIVGPRPMLPEQLPMYGDPKAYNALRPGITGLWQVSARNEEQFSYRNEVDTVYENALSASLDVKILFKTVGVVLRRTGH
jgi:lipopolysaccharide/colanic/teichoic acid biosynthesis glycosyltransferase